MSEKPSRRRPAINRTGQLLSTSDNPIARDLLAVYRQAAKTLVPSFVRFSGARNGRRIWQGLVLPIKLAPGTVLLVCYSEMISHQSEVCEHLFQTSRDAMLIASPIANEAGDVTDGWVVMMNDAARDFLGFRDGIGNLRLKHLPARARIWNFASSCIRRSPAGSVDARLGRRRLSGRNHPLCPRFRFAPDRRGRRAIGHGPSPCARAGSFLSGSVLTAVCSLNVLASGTCSRYRYARDEGRMVQRVATVAFEGIEARAVDVQVQVAPGLPAFNIVGLPDKAVSEARERVRSALITSGLALPARRITVNLAPADLPKEGSHYDLPIALGLMAAIGAIPPDALNGFTVLGELGLDGSIAPVAGVLPAAIGANAPRRGTDLPCAPAARKRPGRAPTFRSSPPPR